MIIEIKGDADYVKEKADALHEAGFLINAQYPSDQASVLNVLVFSGMDKPKEGGGE